MTERQLFAIANPRFRAEGALPETFFRWHRVGRFLISTALSVNK
jgi:hypothetical protein